MISLDQVQLLEEKVSKAIEYVERLTLENTQLASDNLTFEMEVNSLSVENKRLVSENKTLIEEKAALISKLEANQKRIDELEVHILAFKEDQGRIEDGIIAALDRLSQFEEAFEKSLKDGKPKEKNTVTPKETEPVKNGFNDSNDSNEAFFEIENSIKDTIKDSREETSAAASANAETDAELDIF